MAQDAPACPAPVNRWADQRLAQVRHQLKQDHSTERSRREALNPIEAALNWIDDRIIDQRVDDEHQQLLSTVLQSSRCLVQLHP